MTGRRHHHMAYTIPSTESAMAASCSLFLSKQRWAPQSHMSPYWHESGMVQFMVASVGPVCAAALAVNFAVNWLRVVPARIYSQVYKYDLREGSRG